MSDRGSGVVHVERALDPHERATIAAALAYFARALSIEDQIEELARYDGDAMPLPEHSALALARDVAAAPEVKLCSRTLPTE